MSIKCGLCGKDTARVQHVTRSYGKGPGILVIENVPVINCSSCGESYLDAETLHEQGRDASPRHPTFRNRTTRRAVPTNFEIPIRERIKSNRKKLAVRRPLAVAEYA